MVANVTFAQKRTRLGIHANTFDKDFGGGIHVISPKFTRANLAIKVSGSYNVHQSKYSYTNLLVGIRTSRTLVKDKWIGYAEGGNAIIFPSNDFPSQRAVLGGYGLLGFEYVRLHNTDIYIEFGGIGTGAKSNLEGIGKTYANGLLINVGLRFNVF